MTKEKINFFEETLNKIPKKVNNDKINENLLKLLPPSPNIIKKKNLVKFNSKNIFNSGNKKEKHVRNMKSFENKSVHCHTKLNRKQLAIIGMASGSMIFTKVCSVPQPST